MSNASGEQKGTTSNQYYQAILQSLFESLLITDAQGRILENNARSEELFHYKAGELLNRPLSDIVFGFDERILQTVMESLVNQKHMVIEASCVSHDGSTFPAEIAVTKTTVGVETRLCFSVRNVSARKETQEELENAQEKLLAMERIKARMETITTMAHEINNPLQTLMSMVEADKNVRYGRPLNRIAAVMHELRRAEELKTIKYAGTSNRFALLGPDMEPCVSKNVLIVDDEDTLLKFFEAVLSEKIRGLKIDCAPNGAEALASFQVKHHAIIMLDICMPVMDGEKAFHELKKICKDKNWEMPAIIFCTGYTPPESIQEAIAKDSAHCYLAKPVTSETIVNAVRNRLELYDLSRGKPDQAKP
jgi:PAS domain S-box-containing protein